VYSGKEEIAEMRAFCTTTGLVESAAQQGREVSCGTTQGGAVRLRPCRTFLCGDHNLLVRMRVCYGPQATIAGHSICMYCQEDTSVLQQWPDRAALDDSKPLPADALWTGDKWQVRLACLGGGGKSKNA
jgi:hypothetical protein